MKNLLLVLLLFASIMSSTIANAKPSKFQLLDPLTLEPPFTLNNAPTYLMTPTHEGSGQVVHPDILYFEKKNVLPDNYSYIMAITPYATEDSEVPNILYSKNGLDWEVEPALNPVVPHLGVEPDPSMVFKDNKFYLFYAQYKIGGVEVDEGRVYESADSYEYANISIDGLPWLAEVIYDPTDYKLKNWEMQNNGTIFYRQSVDGLHWLEQAGKFDLPPSPYIYLNGHMEVERMSNGEYWCVFGATNFQTSINISRWFMKSVDGLNWQGCYKTPVISPSENGWDNSLIYKSHFIVENGVVRYWYSARNRFFYFWHLGYTNTTIENRAIWTVSNIIVPSDINEFNDSIILFGIVFIVLILIGLKKWR
jgi:hypothetical protein